LLRLTAVDIVGLSGRKSAQRSDWKKNYEQKYIIYESVYKLKEFGSL
jgi:hypothetical protein